MSTLVRTLTAVAAVLALFAAPAAAQENKTPQELEGIDIIDHAGDKIPLDVTLVDENGEQVKLGSFFNHDRPVLVQLVYYGCPMLCTLVLNGYVEGAKELDWTPGEEYDVLTVSFDPRDTPELAKEKRKGYLESLGHPEAGKGWRFLTGEKDQVKRLADALGFRYRWFEEKGNFAHGAGMFVLTPDGTISRTLYGIEYSERDLRLSLTEASQGKLGSPVDKVLLFCFSYDPETHKYALVARNVMKLGGVVTIVALGLLIGILVVRDRRRHRAAGAAA